MDLQELVALRRDLAALAEPSGAEERTASYLANRLARLRPAHLLDGIGGHGVAAVLEGPVAGPTLLLRADMDALPVSDSPGGFAHRCGHDGHMAMLLGAAARWSVEPPRRGRIVLIFQPAEETGAGARAVLAHPAFAALKGDHTVALHNLPGRPLGEVTVHRGTAAVASRGLVAVLSGKPSHAAEPEAGRSPVGALATLARDLPQLPTAPQYGGNARLTIVGLEAGDRSFGTSPGRGSLRATLRADDDATLDRLAAACTGEIERVSAAAGLACDLAWHEVFPATVNDPATASAVAAAAADAGLAVVHPERPFAWSEDFGHFAAAGPAALVGLGAGEEAVPLHGRHYEFPDALLPVGVDLWGRIVARLAGG